jgi:hypothetical protein
VFTVAPFQLLFGSLFAAFFLNGRESTKRKEKERKKEPKGATLNDPIIYYSPTGLDKPRTRTGWNFSAGTAQFAEFWAQNDCKDIVERSQVQ